LLITAPLKPSKSEPLDIDHTIGDYLRWLYKHYQIFGIWCDPWQLHQLITNLSNEGLPIEEFPQTSANLTRATQNFYDLLIQKNLILPDDEELEQQAQNAVAVESRRGLRLAKEKSGRKIDAIVALTIACLFATEEMNGCDAGAYFLQYRKQLEEFPKDKRTPEQFIAEHFKWVSEGL